MKIKLEKHLNGISSDNILIIDYGPDTSHSASIFSIYLYNVTFIRNDVYDNSMSLSILYELYKPKVFKDIPRTI